jgi:hypothetical protein
MGLTIEDPMIKASIDALSRTMVRDLGLTLKIKRIGKLNELSAGEQLLAAVLRADSETAALLLGDSTKETSIATFMLLVREWSLSCLVLDRLYGLELVKAFGDQHCAQLRHDAAKEMVLKRTMDQVLADILTILKPVKDRLVWVKGVSLSRTVYDDALHRGYGDYDLVIHPSALAETIGLLEQHSFHRRITDPGSCNQFGVGPIESPMDMFIAPDCEWTPPSSLIFRRYSEPALDIKVSPLDRGVRMCELDRLFAEATKLSCLGKQFLAPSLVDHLMISLHTLMKDRFRSWKTLLDVHLLCSQVAKEPHLWDVLVERCHKESIQSTAWAGLLLSADRLGTVIPHSVIERLAPGKNNLRHAGEFLASPYFVWNATSLPMLLLNAAAATDRRRKLALLSKSLMPPREFLLQYYRGIAGPSSVSMLMALWLHWIVVLLPGGLIRRTFGHWVWPPAVYNPAAQPPQAQLEKV